MRVLDRNVLYFCMCTAERCFFFCDTGFEIATAQLNQQKNTLWEVRKKQEMGGTVIFIHYERDPHFFPLPLFIIIVDLCFGSAWRKLLPGQNQVEIKIA